jgi:hypothetical protein
VTDEEILWLKSIGLLVLGVLIPLCAISVLIMLNYKGFADVPRPLAVIILILPGFVPIRFLPWPTKWRIVGGLVYSIGMFIAVPLYALVFACTFTGDCI